MAVEHKFEAGDYFYHRTHGYISKIIKVLYISPFSPIYEHTGRYGKINYSTSSEIDPWTRELTDEEKAKVL